MPVRVIPARGEIWLADLAPTRGREQSGLRPVLILSIDDFNEGPADLVIVVPKTDCRTARPSQRSLERKPSPAAYCQVEQCA